MTGEPTSADMPDCLECIYKASDYTPTDEEREALDRFMLMCAAVEANGEEGYEQVPATQEENDFLMSFRYRNVATKYLSQNVWQRGRTIGAGRCAIWGFDPKSVAFFARENRRPQTGRE